MNDRSCCNLPFASRKPAARQRAPMQVIENQRRRSQNRSFRSHWEPSSATARCRPPPVKRPPKPCSLIPVGFGTSNGTAHYFKAAAHLNQPAFSLGCDPTSRPCLLPIWLIAAAIRLRSSAAGAAAPSSKFDTPAWCDHMRDTSLYAHQKSKLQYMGSSFCFPHDLDRQVRQGRNIG